MPIPPEDRTRSRTGRPEDPVGRRIREIDQRVAGLQEHDQYTYLQPVAAVEGTHVTIGGRQLLLASSYSYLGLLGHPVIQAAARTALEHYGTGLERERLGQ